MAASIKDKHQKSTKTIKTDKKGATNPKKKKKERRDEGQFRITEEGGWTRTIPDQTASE